MIAGIFHQGSGLGDQLFRYITARTLALDKGYSWTMQEQFNFKGKDFINILMSSTNIELWGMTDKYWEEKKILENGIDIRSYDPEINFVEDNTVIDGCFEDEKYWGHRLPEIRKWLKVEPLEMSNNLCVINFRGGEYQSNPDLFLTKDYWNKALKIMKDKYPNIKFEVHTDDPLTAARFFSNIIVLQRGIDINWRSIRYANHLILSNSAFGILPALLNENVKEVIAPRYWARRNTKVWARPSCYYKDKRWIYI